MAERKDTNALQRGEYRYLRDAGIEHDLIETDVFGKLTLNVMMEDTRYVRYFLGLPMISEVITLLMWEGFWLWLK